MRSKRRRKSLQPKPVSVPAQSATSSATAALMSSQSAVDYKDQASNCSEARCRYRDIKPGTYTVNSLYAGRACSPNPNCSNLQKTNASASSQDSDEPPTTPPGRQLTPLTPEGRAERPFGFSIVAHFRKRYCTTPPYEVNGRGWSRGNCTEPLPCLYERIILERFMPIWCCVESLLVRQPPKYTSGLPSTLIPDQPIRIYSLLLRVPRSHQLAHLL